LGFGGAGEVCFKHSLKYSVAGYWWLMPVIPGMQEAEIRRTEVQNQPGQIVCETPIWKMLNTKKDWPRGSISKYKTLSSNLSSVKNTVSLTLNRGSYFVQY
jgi:hypothetical protein